jgi:hypothetical protein
MSYSHNVLRSDLPELPMRMRRLPIDARGFPVPFFVAWLDASGAPSRRGYGTPDFRVVYAGTGLQCHKESLCWLCGERLGTFKTFVIGPMCAINRTSSEPPSHLDCADFAARACPFLTRPKEKRNEKNMPPGWVQPPGEMIRRNPGCTLVWTVRKYEAFKVDGGILFDVGEPEHVRWYREGRPATRAEILESIDSGMPILRKAAEEDGEAGLEELDRRYAALAPLLPVEIAS